MIIPSQRPLSDNAQPFNGYGGIRTYNPNKRAAADRRLRPQDHRYRPRVGLGTREKSCHSISRSPAEDVKSYRPISLLPILSKGFEKLFYNPNTTHLTIHTNNTGTPIWIQKKTFHHRTCTSHHQYNSQGNRKQTILYCGLPRYQSGL